jgi:uncharacterized repeat protein (TIGR03803 family)
MGRIVGALGKPNWGKRAYAVVVLCAITRIALPAQTFTTLVSFDATDGYWPYAGLVQATNGYLYGTTYAGGANGLGTVFKITQSGTLTTLHSFDGTDGANPYAGLVQATNGDLYGTTYSGGANCSYPCGTVFKITPSGTLTTLYNFCSQSGCTDGSYPRAGLAQGANGDLYGTTYAGGTNDSCYEFQGTVGCGTVFKITPSGKLTMLYNFCSQSACTDGVLPAAGLVQAANGDFYGTTQLGGANCAMTPYCGTVFKITPSGTLTTLYNFCAQQYCTDGSYPNPA